MNVSVLQQNLAKALNLSSRFVSTRVQIPILSHIRFRAAKNKLYLQSTNLESSCSVSIGAKVSSEGSVAIPARVVTDLVSNLPSGQVALEAQKEALIIKSENFRSQVSR